jgi:hypothetical protein
MGSGDPGFETGFEKPSLENPVLFARYADSIAARLRMQYNPSGGYRVAVEKHEKDPKKRRWEVNVYRGLFAGAQVTIKPAAQMPHRAMVEVSWHTRLFEILVKTLAVLSLPIFIVLLLAFALKTRLGFALILTAVIGFAWTLAGGIVILVIAKLCSATFGNEFDYKRRSAMAQEVRAVPLPAHTE